MLVLDNSITSLSPEGHLLVDTGECLGHKMMVTKWGTGTRFYLGMGGSWEHQGYDPGLLLVSGDPLSQGNTALQAFLGEVPPRVVRLLGHYQYRQFILLGFLSHNKALLDVFGHSPNLFWLVVAEAVYRGWGQGETRVLLQQKHRDIVRELTGQRSEATARFINKIMLTHGDKGEYRLVREVLADRDVVSAFFHWGTIPVQALAVIKKCPGFLGSNLLKSLANSEESPYRQTMLFSNLDRTMQDIRQMAGVIGAGLPASYFNNISSLEGLEQAHLRMIRRFNNSGKLTKMDVVEFPVSPLGDKEGLVQIKDSHELIAEGKLMHHCVGGYQGQAEKGQCYFYRVMSPERGTLQIRFIGGKPSIIQFRLACNKKPSGASLARVMQLLGL